MSKSVQQFECRDDVWKRVVALAKRRGISTDDVVVAALVQLFKRRSDDAGAAASSPGAPAVTATPAVAPASTAQAPVPPPRAEPAAARPAPQRAPTPEPRPAPPARAPARPADAVPPAAHRSAPAPSGAGGPPGVARPGGHALPRPGGRPPEPAARPAPAAAKAMPLYLFCEGQWYTIDQDQFVIGRGSKFSDLPIKDANISRRHAAVVRRNGQYYIKDLGSTNGIEFNGERVDDHRVNDGAVYFLCDHELRFSFTSPF